MLKLCQPPPTLTTAQKKRKRQDEEQRAKAEYDKNKYKIARKAEEQAELSTAQRLKQKECRRKLRLRNLHALDPSFKKDLFATKHVTLCAVWQKHALTYDAQGKLQRPVVSQRKFDFLRSVVGGEDIDQQEFCLHLHDLYADEVLDSFEYISYREWDHFKTRIDKLDPL